MEVRSENCNVDEYAAKLFQIYSETVFADDYAGLQNIYDHSAVLIERGKETFYGVDSIIKAIKAYHAELGNGTTKNTDFKVEYTDNTITIFCKYCVQSILSNETLEGEYIQYWKSEVGEYPKIIRDEFSIDRKY